MKRPSPALMVAAMVAALGTLGYQVREIAQCRTALAREQKRLEQMEQQLAELKAQHAAAARQLELTSAALAENSAAAPAATTTVESDRAPELDVWLTRLRQLKQSLDEHPEQRIPEFQFLTDLDWMMVARSARFETEEDRRKAWAEVRNVAFGKFRERLNLALRDYANPAPGLPLPDLAQLLPHFKPPIDATILQRYELVGDVPAPGKNDRRKIIERLPVDEEFDTQHNVTLDGAGVGSTPWITNLMQRSVEEGMRAFAAANGGRQPRREDDILPYVPNPLHRAIVSAMQAASKDHPGRAPSDLLGLRPYVTDPPARAFLEKMIRVPIER